MKHDLIRRCCSEAWVEAQFKTFYDKGPDGQTIAIVMHDASVYPPKANTTPMCLCSVCCVPYPPQYVATMPIFGGRIFGSISAAESAKDRFQPECGAVVPEIEFLPVCLDCSIAASPHRQRPWGPSSWATAMSVIRSAQLKLHEPHCR